ncbi:MAG TPA: SRPBCC family protein [Candidatus Binatia bacterium]|jgi:uncharacterized membrane protein
MADVQQSFSTAIEAPADLCFAAIADFEAYPSWSSPITRIDVLDRYEDGFARSVEFLLDMKLRTVRYVLRYIWNPPHHLSWTFVEGDVDDIVGSYVFEPLDGNRTKATCSQAVTLSFWVPGLIQRTLESTALRQSVLEFKAEAERRAAGRRV